MNISRRTVIRIQYAAAAFALVAAAYLFFDWGMGAVIHSRRDVTVPDLSGKSAAEALSLLSPSNLGLKKQGEEANDTVPAGTIVRQNPLPGMTVKEGKIVRVTLSQGGKVMYVPGVTGQKIRAAEIALRGAGLALGEVSSRFSLRAAKDDVIAQDPAGGTICERDALVDLVVSAGPPSGGTLLMPDFSAMSSDDAVRWGQDNAITVSVRAEAAGGVAPGTILRQDPAPDTDITGQKNVYVFAAGLSGDAGSTPLFTFELPQGGDKKTVAIIARGADGMDVSLYRGERVPGTKLTVPVAVDRPARVRVMVNGVQVDEREFR